MATCANRPTAKTSRPRQTISSTRAQASISTGRGSRLPGAKSIELFQSRTSCSHPSWESTPPHHGGGGLGRPRPQSWRHEVKGTPHHRAPFLPGASPTRTARADQREARWSRRARLRSVAHPGLVAPPDAVGFVVDVEGAGDPDPSEPVDDLGDLGDLGGALLVHRLREREVPVIPASRDRRHRIDPFEIAASALADGQRHHFRRLVGMVGDDGINDTRGGARTGS